MKVLVINSGSSSLKYSLFVAGETTPLCTGLVERIGERIGNASHHLLALGDKGRISQRMTIPDHRQGLAIAVGFLMDETYGSIRAASEIAAIGHRVVHGGERFRAPTLIDEDVMAAINELAPFAPLHNPPNLLGIQVAEELFPDAVQVAVFDTAFHQTMPPAAYRYAIPRSLYADHGIRAYGFHGTSHHYVAKRAAQYLGMAVADTRLITIHLGNGCSMAAIQGGRSIDTSMGFSPLDGLMMGTRSGDLDPAIPFFLGTKLGMSFGEIDRLLNKESGLLGMTGSNDVRDIQIRQLQGDADATLALDMYTWRIRKYIGAYMAILGGVDAIVFTAGVGENSAWVRQHSCQGLEGLGVVVDPEKNQHGSTADVTEIQAQDSKAKVLIIPTNEELEIAVQTSELMRSRTA